MIPMMPHMKGSSEEREWLHLLLAFGPLGRRRAGLQLRTKRGCPPVLCDLPGSPKSDSARWYILRNCTCRGHVSAPADAHGRHQRAVGPDEGVVTDHGAPLTKAIVVHGDRAGADVAPGTDVGVAEIGEMVGLGATPHP